MKAIQELRSINGSGAAFVVVTFDLKRDIDAAAQDVRDRVATVVRDLPRDTDPPTIAKSDTDQSPILSLALSGNRSQRELTEIADKIVKTQIERSAGVGEVNLSARLGARDQCVGGCRPAGRLPDPHHRGARCGGAPERQHSRRQRHRRPARADLAHDGAAAATPTRSTTW